MRAPAHNPRTRLPRQTKRNDGPLAEVALPNAVEEIMAAGKLPTDQRPEIVGRLRAAGMFFDFDRRMPEFRKDARELRIALERTRQQIEALQVSIRELEKRSGGLTSLIQPVNDVERAAGFPNLALYDRLRADLRDFDSLLKRLIEQRQGKEGRGGARRHEQPGIRDLIIRLAWLYEIEALRTVTFGSEAKPLGSPFVCMLVRVWKVLKLASSPEALRKRAMRTLR